MNDTESFEHVMAEMRKVVMDCDMERCDMYDGDCYQCQGDILDRMQRAHERELEHVRKAEYARGYHDGQRSMDAEHYAVALRLMHLPLDGGSHENLSQIARAVYHADFGWTQGACKALRDELVRLMGGCVCDNASNSMPFTTTVTTSTYDAFGNERHEAVCRLREWAPDEDGTPHRGLWEAVMGEKLPTAPLKGDAELDIIMRDRLVHLLGGVREPFGNFAKSGDFGKLDSTNDGEIDNERHKAIVELRKINTDAGGFVKALANALGVEWHAPRVHQTIAEVRDRLIHLLGGDEPTLRKIAAELYQLSVGAMSRRADQPHESSPMRLENETGITAKLREKIHEKVNQELYVVVEADDLYAIADRIDERFNHAMISRSSELGCYKLRAMLTEQRDDARAKVLKLESENAEWRRGAELDADKLESLTGAYNDAVAERDELRKKLEELEKFDRDTSLAAFGDDNEELRKLLSRAAKLLASAEQDRDANYAYWMDCKEKVVHANVTIDELSKELENARDALNEATGRWAKADEERRELQAKLNAIREAVDAL